jgi:RNA polymerase sigma factor (sigma-70 family)
LNSSHKTPWTLTQESFDRLLAWLDPDREQAGRIYEDIRSNLIRGFRRHHCPVPEDLADRTINRVAKKLPEVESDYSGSRTPYFFAVAHNIHREYLREKAATVPLSVNVPSSAAPLMNSTEEAETEDACLKICMERLPPHHREIILQYYRGDKQVKIRLRKELAQRLGIGLPLLRLKAQRIRVNLKKCILGCLTEQAAA